MPIRMPLLSHGAGPAVHDPAEALMSGLARDAAHKGHPRRALAVQQRVAEGVVVHPGAHIESLAAPLVTPLAHFIEIHLMPKVAAAIANAS